MYNRPLIVLDTETTTINKGDPYNPNNKLVSLYVFDGITPFGWYKQFDTHLLQILIDTHTLILANGKFDLAWLRRLHVNLDKAEVIDIQYAEFLINNQTTPYPSVEEMAIKYLNKHKIDNIKLNYWDKGIDTWFIPEAELREYNQEDVILEWEIWQAQKIILHNTNKLALLYVHCKDLLVLEEMQWNGIKYDVENSLKKAKEIEEQSKQLKQQLIKIANLDCFDPNSNDHLSALLYGGSIVETIKLPIGVYKTGAKVGHTRYKNLEKIHTLPRLIEPLPGSEYKKGNVWSTDETTLQLLSAKGQVKQIIKLILERRGLEKLNSTYLLGFPKKIQESQWENNIIHSTLNQCVAKTGRLTSTKPNQQNMDETTKQFCISRYK